MNSKGNSKTKKGISLIVLVITIIVIIILASAVILSLSQNNPIQNATEATFKQNLGEYKSELSLYITSEYAKNNGNFDSTTINKTGSDIKTVITSMKDDDTNKFEIFRGQLVYLDSSTTDTEKQYAQDVGIMSKSSIEWTVSTKNTDNKTFSGATTGYTYNNPVIPAGFVAVDTDTAKWEDLSTDWNNGLVIQDNSGNQFVWLPVDGTNVKYVKNFSYPSLYGTSYTSSNTTDDAFPEGLNETSLESKYQGFYVGRYESSFDYNGGNLCVSIKKSSNTTVDDWSSSRDSLHTGYLWNFIDYADAKSYSENMCKIYDTSKVGTNLITGTQWDTIMGWVQNSGLDVSSDSSSWGNFINVSFLYTYPKTGIKDLNTSILLNTGATNRNSSKNIYDIAGNIWEWTSEFDHSYSFIRGRSYRNSGAASQRLEFGLTSVKDDIGFRVALYIK